MEVEEKGENPAAQGRERRKTPRSVVDEEAQLLLVRDGFTVPCRIVELSLEGCRIKADARLPAGMLVRMETSFKVRGMPFRFSGVGIWTDGANQVGIRFVNMPARRRDELAEILREVEEKNAARAKKQAAEKLAAEEQAAEKLFAKKRAAEERAAKRVTAEQRAAEERAGQEAGRQAALEAASREAAKPVKRERRTQSRHEVDTSASILLVNIGAWLQGRILDLSVGGCRIRTDERFPVGIYTRVEAEFRIDGLPFRLGGVIQSVHDQSRRLVGIRFLSVSERKRAQLEQLIQEIEELRARRSPAEPPSSL
jgi:flagellar biosynthesis GTPase FlhF